MRVSCPWALGVPLMASGVHDWRLPLYCTWRRTPGGPSTSKCSCLMGVPGLENAVEVIRAALAANGPAKRRVLVVDDSEDTARLLNAELTAQGHEVMSAHSADAATKIILKKKTRPDLVLLDVHMPGVNGEEFCRFIKGNSLFAGIQVVLCSAEEEVELQRITKAAGADGYVRKDALIAKEILELLT